MKGRKFNIIFNLSTLILVIAFSAVSVYAAVTQTLGVSTTVSFTATEVKGTIYGTIEGVTTPQNYASSGTPNQITAGGTLSNWSVGATTITISNDLPSNIVFTIVITNTTSNGSMSASIGAISCGTNLSVDKVEQKANTASSFSTKDSPYDFTSLTPYVSASDYGKLTIKVTIKVTDPTVNVSSAAIGYTLSLGRA